MSEITINGRTFHVRDGASVSIINEKVAVDGENIDYESTSKILNIFINGTIEKVETTSADLTVNGNVFSAQTKSGDISIDGDVVGSVSAVSGDIDVLGEVHGNVTTVSGDISRR